MTWNGSIPAGGSVTITITATILPAPAGTTITNQGTIAFDADGNGTNESTAQTDDPATGDPADPTSFVVGGIAAGTIPPSRRWTRWGSSCWPCCWRWAGRG